MRACMLLASAGAGALALVALVASPAAASPPAALHCGQTLTHSVTLEADLVDCPGDGLVIGADGITVDLNGHTIDGVAPSGCEPSASTTVGIDNGDGYDGVTVEDGTITQFDEGFSAGSETTGMSDSHIHHLTLSDRFGGIGLETGAGPAAIARNLVDHNVVSGVPCGGGIAVTGGQDNRLADNDIENVAVVGIFDVGDHGDVIAHNRIARTGHHGVYVFASTASRVLGNVLTETDRDPNHRGDGIRIEFSSNAVVTNNRLTRVDDFGIVVNGCFIGCDPAHPQVPTGIRVERNTLDQTGDGIILINTDDDLVRGNSVTGAGSFGDPASFGLGVLLDGVSDTIVRANAIADGGRGIGPGIVVGIPPEFGPSPRPVSGNVVARNRVTRQHADGILVAPVAQDTILTRNIADDNAADGIHVLSPATTLRRNIADGNGAFGIEAVPGVIDAGGNEASGNGNPAQCTGVVCG
jgi:Right handed beta helix region